MMEHLVKVDATIGEIKGSNGLLVGGIHVTGSNLGMAGGGEIIGGGDLASKQGSSCEKSVSPLFLPNSNGFTVAIVHFYPRPLPFLPPPHSKSRLQIRFYALPFTRTSASPSLFVTFNLTLNLSSFFLLFSLGMLTFPFVGEF